MTDELVQTIIAATRELAAEQGIDIDSALDVNTRLFGEGGPYGSDLVGEGFGPGALSLGRCGFVFGGDAFDEGFLSALAALGVLEFGAQPADDAPCLFGGPFGV